MISALIPSRSIAALAFLIHAAIVSASLRHGITIDISTESARAAGVAARLTAVAGGPTETPPVACFITGITFECCPARHGTGKSDCCEFRASPVTLSRRRRKLKATPGNLRGAGGGRSREDRRLSPWYERLEPAPEQALCDVPLRPCPCLQRALPGGRVARAAQGARLEPGPRPCRGNRRRRRVEGRHAAGP